MKVKIEQDVRRSGSYDLYHLLITHDGHQWFGMSSLTPDQLAQVRDHITAFLEGR